MKVIPRRNKKSIKKLRKRRRLITWRGPKS